MRKLTRLMAILLSVAATFGIVACGGTEEKSNVTYLYVGSYGGGFGEEWLKQLERGFEEKYKDYPFEDGKVGVDVQPITNKATMSGMQLISSLKSEQRETVFFTIDALYYDFIKEGLLYDITDAVSEKLNEYGEDKSILDKLSDDVKDYFRVNDKYYAIPFCDIFTGLVYDVDLFEEAALYFAKDGGFVKDGKDKTQRSYGPDGKTGVIDGIDYSVDDGLPATFEQFYALCNRIVAKNYLPFVWTGEYLNYMNSFLFSVVSDVLGKDEMQLNFTANGASDDLAGYEKGYGINEENAYLLAKQNGKKDALDFAEKIVRNNTWYDASKCFSGSFSHTQAQEYFLGAKYEQSLGKRAAMLVEGNYWQNEASSAFDELVSAYGEGASKANRRFATMPTPKISESALGKRTITTGGNSVCFMNGKCPENKVKVSKMFIQYAHTEAKLREFTEITDIPRPYDYEIGESFGKLSYFGKDLWQLRSSSDIIPDYRTAEAMKRNPSSFTISTFWSATGTTNNPFTQFNGNKSYTAQQYFDAMYTFNETMWKGLKK